MLALIYNLSHMFINLLYTLLQVGGHTRLMVLNPSTICKPLNIRELEFYQNIQDQDIKIFVPKYKGKLSRLSQWIKPHFHREKENQSERETIQTCIYAIII